MVARNRIVLTGRGGASVNEPWSVGLHFALADGGAVSGQPALQAWATGIATVLDGGETDYTSLTAMMSEAMSLTGVQVYEFGDSGPAVAQGIATYNWSGVGTIRGPLSTCCVIRHDTTVVGRSFRGRTYWPAAGTTITTGGKLALLTGVATEFAELLNDIAAASPDPLTVPVVYSPTRDLLTPVSTVRAGDAPDTQRRRDDGLAEIFQTATV